MTGQIDDALGKVVMNWPSVPSVESYRIYGRPEPTKAAWRVIRYMKTLIDAGDSEEAVKAKAAKKYPELKSQGWMFRAAMADMQEGETL